MLSFLFGAGASFEARLPLATELTDRVIEKIDIRDRPLLEFTRRSIQTQVVARAAENGSRTMPDLGVDSETLYNTVNDLVHRDSLDIAPFVSNWHPLLQSGGPPASKREIESALRKALRQDDFSTFGIQDLAALLSSSQGNQFQPQMLTRIQRAVIEQLRVSDETPVDYLAPLGEIADRQGGLSIASLNYDMVVETALKRFGITWSDGIGSDEEQAHSILNFQEAQVHLLKLHGSAEWFSGDPQHSIIKRKHYQQEGIGQQSHVILFGGRNKLTVEWPFFSLLWKWREALESTLVLCAVGYSFRDDHVNALVLNWLGSHEDRSLVVIDPKFPDRQETREHFLNGYAWTQSNESMSHWVYDLSNGSKRRSADGPPEKPKLIIKRTGTRQGLIEVRDEYGP